MNTKQVPPMGWIPPDQRTGEQTEINNRIIAGMPAFSLIGEKPPVGFKILLTDLWKEQIVVDTLGFAFPGWHQFTGSCVGVGFGNGAQTLNLGDAVLRKESEKIALLFWMYNYGRSRQLAGMNGQGEGSMGSTIAKSAADDGLMEWSEVLGCPTVTNGDQLEVGKKQEVIWSDGRHASPEIRAAAKPHKVTSAQLSSAEQVRDGLINGYPSLRAFGKYVNPGSASVRNGVLMSRGYDGRGGHQESWLGYWNHPDLGELFYEMNQWGKKVYGTDPAGGAPGGCWVSFDAVDAQCRNNNSEIFVLSQYDGYPEQPKFRSWTEKSWFV